MRISDCSSDVCSSDLIGDRAADEARCLKGVEAAVAKFDASFELVGRLGCDEVDRPSGRIVAEQCPLRSLEHLDALQIRSEEHTSELQSLMRISYAVFCLKKKTINKKIYHLSHTQ